MAEYYNYFREYDAALGRYLQSDPIGLRGGSQTFGYVASRPLVHSDSKGLLLDGSGDRGPRERCILYSEIPLGWKIRMLGPLPMIEFSSLCFYQCDPLDACAVEPRGIVTVKYNIWRPVCKKDFEQ